MTSRQKPKKQTQQKGATTLIAAAVLMAFILPFAARGASPYSFEAMYATAARGDVAGLRSAVHRGLKIDSPDSRGDTGICAAIKRRDYKAYNSFIMAGASSAPACLAYIAPTKYQKFMKSGQIVSLPHNQYVPAAAAMPSGGNSLPPRYVSERQAQIVERELARTANTGNAYNLLYMPVSLLLSFFP